MQRALQRIERRVQRERMIAVTGNAEADSDEEHDEDGDQADGGEGEGAEQDEDGNNDKEDGEDEQEDEQMRGPKDQYDLKDDFIDDSEVPSRAIHRLLERNNSHSYLAAVLRKYCPL
jgi:hypothetical protein